MVLEGALGIFSLTHACFHATKITPIIYVYVKKNLCFKLSRACLCACSSPKFASKGFLIHALFKTLTLAHMAYGAKEKNFGKNYIAFNKN